MGAELKPGGASPSPGSPRVVGCIVCGTDVAVRSAGFTQLYRQHVSTALRVPWWECPACRSWFGAPHPRPAEIADNWGATTYNDPAEEAAVAASKRDMQQMLLDLVERHVGKKGVVLDYGCNFGRFLEMARERGWIGLGVDASPAGVEATRARGFTAHECWELERAPLEPSSLDAIVSNDVFYYVWSPYQHLRRAHELLRPGGVLAMRTSNKRVIEGLVRRALPPGSRRDRLLSRLLQDQFHAIDVRVLARVMETLGFKVVEIQSGAMTAPLQRYSLPSRALYSVAATLDQISRGRVNISPGVCLVAQKP